MNSINHFLELIAKEVKNRLGILCSDRMTLDDQLASARGSAYYMQVGMSCHLRQMLAYPKVNTLLSVLVVYFLLQSHSHKGKKAARNVPQQLVNPGDESYRRLLEESVRYLFIFSVAAE